MKPSYKTKALRDSLEELEQHSASQYSKSDVKLNSMLP